MFSILLIGPAFLSSKQKPQPVDTQTLDFIPSKLIDADARGGGNRNAKPPPAAQPAFTPPPQPSAHAVIEKPREPEALKPEKVSKVDPDSVEPNTASKPHRPQISTQLITRKSDTPKTKTKNDSDTKAEERQLADARRKLGQQLASAAASIGKNLSPATTIEDPYGPGGGGPSYANYAAFVRSVYETAWQEPSDTSTDEAITKVSVTIASDGHVLFSKITRSCGDPQVDRSVQRTLDRVTFIAPFPEGAKEKQRTYIINFNLKAKRGLA